MNVEELVNGLKEKGLDEEQIKVELMKIKEEICKFLGEGEKEPEEPIEKEVNDKNIKEVFGY